MIQLEKVTKNYGKTRVLFDVSLTLKKGLYCLVGPNGAGKSTLIKLITSTNTPSSGQLLWKGKEIKNNLEHYCSCIGYLPQDFSPYKHFTAKRFLQHICILKNIHNSAQIELEVQKALSQTGLLDKTNSRCSTLSGGMIRRLGIAQALLGNPKLIILDEPAAGLDPDEQIRLKKLIQDMASSTIVLLSTHLMSQIDPLTSQIIFISKGHITALGTASKLWMDLKTSLNPDNRTAITRPIDLEDLYLHYQK